MLGQLTDLSIILSTVTLVVLLFSYVHQKKNFQMNRIADLMNFYNSDYFLKVRSADIEVLSEKEARWIKTQVCDYFDQLAFFYYNRLVNKKAIRSYFGGSVVYYWKLYRNHVLWIQEQQGWPDKMMYFKRLAEELGQTK